MQICRMTWNLEWKPHNILSAQTSCWLSKQPPGNLREKMPLLQIISLKSDVLRGKSWAIIKLFPCKYFYTLFLTVNFALIVHLSPGLPSASIPSSIFRHFRLQTNLQPNSHPILISPLLQCSFPQPLARVDRCREWKGGRQSQLALCR